MRPTVLLVVLVLLAQGCGASWMTIPSSHVYVAEADGPVALFVLRPDEPGAAGIACVDLSTRARRWTIPNAHPNLLAFSRDRTHLYFVAQPEAAVRLFRTRDGAELSALSAAALGEPDLSRFETQIAVSADGRFVAAAGRHGGKAGARLRLIALPTGKRRDRTFEQSWAVSDLRFGPAGWLAVRAAPDRQVLYTYDEARLGKQGDLAATQGWWAADRLVFVTPAGRFGTVGTDGRRHDIPAVALGAEVADMLGSRPERVRVAPDGEHLIYDGGDHLVLWRLRDGATIFRAACHGHRGSGYQGVLASAFTGQTATIAYTANEENDGMIATIDLRDGRARLYRLGRLGRYEGGLPGFDIRPTFRWQQRPLLTPDGAFLIRLHDDDATVEPLRIAPG